MQLTVIVLNKTECLEPILAAFDEAGIHGATILDSAGMAHSLYKYDELHFRASLRRLINPEREESKTVFMVTDESQVATISKIVNTVTGGLSQPDTGIIFSLPVNYVEGLK